MRSTHVRWLLVALSSGLFVTGALQGCGGGSDGNGSGDDGGGGGETSIGDDGGTGSDTGGGTDSGGGDDSGSDAGPGLHAMATDISVYLGQMAQLDASGSTPPGATFAWTVKSIPAGSTINTGSLLNANAAKPTFTPDKLGDYVLTVTVTSNGANDAKDVTVHAISAQTFYVDYNLYEPDGAPIDGGQRATFEVVPIVGGDGGVPIACPRQGSSGADYTTIAEILHAADQWEGPAGTPPRALATAFDTQPDGGTTQRLLALTSVTSCSDAAAPLELDSISNGPPQANAQLNGPVIPRFSPDGNRVLYVKSLAGPSEYSAYIATIGFDGSTPHAQIAPFNVYPDGGPQDDAGLQYTGRIAPRWAPGGKIALASTVQGGRFQIVVMDDANGATPALAMGCTGTIQHFDPLANGDYLVTGNIQLPDGGTGASASDIYVLHPNSGTKECEIVRNLTKFTSTQTSYGFTVSPDRTRIAYTMVDSAADSGRPNVVASAIFTAAIDGSTPPTRIPGTPYGVGGSKQYSYRPPRWVAGGTSLSFEVANGVIDAGNQAYWTSLAASSVSGGDFRTVATADGNGHLIFSFAACSVSHGPGSMLMALGSLGAFLSLVARRRSKKR